MKQTRFTETQIVAILKQQEAGQQSTIGLLIKVQLPPEKPLAITRPVLMPSNPAHCLYCKQRTMHRLISFERGPPKNCMVQAADLLYAII
jgi:hypothetical protein